MAIGVPFFKTQVPCFLKTQGKLVGISCPLSTIPDSISKRSSGLLIGGNIRTLYPLSILIVHGFNNL